MLKKTEITNFEEMTSDSDWLVQGDMVMLAMFNTMFEMFNARVTLKARPPFMNVLDLPQILNF